MNMNKNITIGIVGAVGIASVATIIAVKHAKDVKKANGLFAEAERELGEFAAKFESHGSINTLELVGDAAFTFGRIRDYLTASRCLPTGGKPKVRDLLTRLESKVLEIKKMSGAFDEKVDEICKNVEQLIVKY